MNPLKTMGMHLQPGAAGLAWLGWGESSQNWSVGLDRGWGLAWRLGQGLGHGLGGNRAAPKGWQRRVAGWRQSHRLGLAGGDPKVGSQLLLLPPLVALTHGGRGPLEFTATPGTIVPARKL